MIYHNTVLNITNISLVFLMFLALFSISFESQQAYDKHDINQDNSEASQYYSLAKKYFEQSDYDRCMEYATKAANHYKGIKAWNNLAKAILLVADVHRINSELEVADSIINVNEDYFYKHFDPDDVLFAELFHLKGKIFSDKGDYEKSITFFDKSIEIRKKTKGQSNIELSHSYNYAGISHLKMGNYEKALEFYTKALEIAGADYAKNKPDIATFNQNIGIAYASLGDFDKAMRYFEKSLEINKQILGPNDPAFGLIYYNIGRLSNMLGKYEEALIFFQKARQIYTTIYDKDHPKIGLIYTEEGSIYYENRDYATALDYYKKALYIYQAKYGDKHNQIYKAYNNIGTTYFQKQQYDEALIYLKKIIDKKRNASSTIISARNIANCYDAKSNDASGNDKKVFINQAKHYYLIAIQIAESEFDDNHPELAASLLKYGNFLMKQNKADKAIEYYRKANKIFYKKFDLKNPDVSESFVAIGNYFLKKGNIKEALENYQRSIVAIVEDYNDSTIYSLPKLDNIIIDYYLLNSLLSKAKAFDRLYSENKQIIDLTYGLQTYELAANLIDKIRTSYQTEESKLFLTKNVRSTYLNTIKNSLLLYDTLKDEKYKKQAFEYAEKSKSSILLASVRDVEAKLSGGIPDSLQKLEKEIKSKIVVYDNHIYEEKLKSNPNHQKIKLWEEKLFENNRQLDALISMLEEIYPKYYNLKYNNDVISIEDIQVKLQNKSLIEYTLTDSLLYMFLIKEDYFNVYTFQIDSNCFYNNINIIRTSLNNIDLANHSSDDFRKYSYASYAIYQLLIDSISDIIQGTDLIIIPDGELGYLSFDALVSKKPGTEKINYRSLNYLVKDYLIDYSYSATLLFNEFHQKETPSNKLLAFAPSYNNKELIKKNPYIAARQADHLADNLIPIPGVAEEIKNIGQLIKGDIIEGKNATEAMFKKLAPDYDILHLAMHTIIDDGNQMYSKLVFTLNSEDTLHDGFLNTYEIYNLDLNARMAVLSACNTGVGILQRGEGVMSLARGFIYAGVPGIVMTLWAVEDKSGVDIMTSFYSYIKEGLPKDQALRLSKLDYLESANNLKSHPYFWSAYVNIGDNSPILDKKNNSPFFIIGGGTLLILILMSYYFFVRKRERIQANSGSE